jgi:hypothetical protein
MPARFDPYRVVCKCMRCSVQTDPGPGSVHQRLSLHRAELRLHKAAAGEAYLQRNRLRMRVRSSSANVGLMGNMVHPGSDLAAAASL